MIKKIVLTGGPCAGKTTALAKIEQDLKELGYKVFIVAESATELIKSGLSPVDKNGVGIVEFQKYILKYQLQKEMLYDKIAEAFPHDKIVIIYDRGTLDGKAFVTEDDFKRIINLVAEDLNMKLTNNDLLNRYDMVIHLTSAACGNSKNYTLENNNARTETVEEARKLDKRTVNCWLGHENLQIIDSYDDFNKKIYRILDVIHNFLGNSFVIKKERKFILNNSNYSNLLNGLNYVETHLEQYYIEDNSKKEYERRIREVTSSDGVNYYYCIQKKEQNGIKKIVLEEKITDEQFNNILNSSKVISQVSKNRYTFIYNNQYFKLDVLDDLIILEQVSKDSDKIDIPNSFNIEKEVTDDACYQNINLGNKLTKQNLLIRC